MYAHAYTPTLLRTCTCSEGPCLYNVGNGSEGDWTEHNNLASTHPDIVHRMFARLKELRKTIWSNPNATAAYGAQCQNHFRVFNEKYDGFYGPFCQIDPLPPAPPGPFKPANLTNCTWIAGKGIRPPQHIRTTDATDRTACCRMCGLNPRCVAATLQCYTDGCQCHQHAFQADAHTVDQAWRGSIQ